MTVPSPTAPGARPTTPHRSPGATGNPAGEGGFRWPGPERPTRLPALHPPYRLRPAVEADRDAILRWRNHPKVRQASFTRHAITAAEHATWWQRAHTDPGHHLLVFEWQDVPAGVVTFREPQPPDDTAGWAYYLDVDGLERIGALLPAWVAAERAALGHAFDTMGLHLLRGEVLTDNRPVLDLHRRFGFVVTGSYLRDIDGTGYDVTRLELTRDDRRDVHRQPAGSTPEPGDDRS